MRIKDDDPYRQWVYSIKGAALDAAMLASIPPSQWTECGYAASVSSTRFMEYKGWPMKAFEGRLSLEINANGNPEYRWLASWSREAYGPNRNPVDPRIMEDNTNGPDAATCLARLWLLAVENMNREVRRPDWEIHFRTYMKPVSCPTS
jgi:hypothetical protein